MLAESGFREVTGLREFFIHTNRFAGTTLPDGGTRAMLPVTLFSIHQNSFTGMLPDGGMRAMLSVTYFSIEKNSFAGMLPDSGLREVKAFYTYEN
eukprot:4481373-Amphidinium_carterae.1